MSSHNAVAKLLTMRLGCMGSRIARSHVQGGGPIARGRRQRLKDFPKEGNLEGISQLEKYATKMKNGRNAKSSKRLSLNEAY